jgi:folylpolyglutamate synthase/dihydropteroate synthase
LPLTSAAVERGLAEAWLPGRQEIVSDRPLILVDAAHNVDSARALVETLSRLPDRGPWLVLGMLRDKDVRAMLRILTPHVSGAVVAAPASPRALAAADLAAAWRSVSVLPVEESATVAAAVERARERAGPDGGIAVAGSFVTAAEARAALGLSKVLTYEDHRAWLGRISRDAN